MIDNMEGMDIELLNKIHLAYDNLELGNAREAHRILGEILDEDNKIKTTNT